MNIKEKLKNLNKNSLFIVFSAIGFILLVLFPVWCEGVKGEMVVEEKYDAIHSRWINDHEIVYAKMIRWKTKGAVGGWPRKKRMQICRMNVDVPGSEEVLVDIEYKTIDRREGRFRIYKDKRFQGITRILDLKVSQSRKKIVVSVNSRKFYARSPDPAGKLFFMDYDGANFEWLVKEGQTGGLKVSPNGKYIIFVAQWLPVEMRNIYGNMSGGLLIYNFENRKLRYFLDGGRYWWDEDSNSVIVSREVKTDGVNQTKYFRYNLKGEELGELTKEEKRHLLLEWSPKKTYCLYRDRLYRGDPKSGEEVEYPEGYPPGETLWSPNEERYLFDRNLIDLRDQSVKPIIPEMK